MKYVYFISCSYSSGAYSNCRFFNTEISLNTPITSIKQIKEIEEKLDQDKPVWDKLNPTVIHYYLLRTESTSNK